MVTPLIALTGRLPQGGRALEGRAPQRDADRFRGRGVEDAADRLVVETFIAEPVTARRWG